MRRIAPVVALVLVLVAVVWYLQARPSEPGPSPRVATAGGSTAEGPRGAAPGRVPAGGVAAAPSTTGDAPARPALDCRAPAGDVARVDGVGIGADSVCRELRLVAGEPAQPPSDPWRAQARQLRDHLVDALLVHRALDGLGRPLPDGDVEAAVTASQRGVAPASAAQGVELEVLRRQLRARLELARLVAMRAAGEPTDAELRAAYDADPARYGEPAQVTVTPFVKRLARRLPDDQVAAAGQSVEEFAAAVAQGTGPAAAAKAAGLTALPPFVLDDRGVDPELRAAAVGLAPGAWSAPVRASIGWVVVRVDAVRPATPRPFDQVRDAVRAQVVAERQQRAQAELLGELRAAAVIEDLVAW